jgi:diguanylate cyclase (GGDEF)-like protein
MGTKHGSVGAAPPSPTHRPKRVVALLFALFTVFLAILSALAIVGIQLHSSVRAYVGGEGLWSKAQKDAVFDLDRYLVSGDEDAFADFQKHLSVPFGDRQAREELEKAAPNQRRAADGFLKGRNDPGDVEGMIRLFRGFRWVPEMERAISIWTEADALILELRQLADRIHADVSAGSLDERRRNDRARELRRLNARLTRVEDSFSATLGGAARRLRTLLVAAIITIGLALVFAGAFVARRVAHLLARRELELRESESRNEYRATHDSLTDLPNRALFADRLAVAIHQARRRDQRIAVMFLDFDAFKAVNDTYGHAAGDQVLIEAAQRLRSCLRAEDTVARLGGDEFILLLAGEISHVSHVATMAHKILGTFERPFTVEGREISLSASIGISLFPDAGDDPEQLVTRADAALYRAKEAGGNTFQYFAEARLEASPQKT